MPTAARVEEVKERTKERKKEAVLVFVQQSFVFCNRKNTSPEAE